MLQDAVNNGGVDGCDISAAALDREKVLGVS